MKLSNFKFDRIAKRLLYDIAYATIDVTTGWWIFKTTKRSVGIVATMFDGQALHWQFVDSGFYTPGTQAELLYDDYVNSIESPL